MHSSGLPTPFELLHQSSGPLGLLPPLGVGGRVPTNMVLCQPQAGSLSPVSHLTLIALREENFGPHLIDDKTEASESPSLHS